jgi:hypothetical protein
MPKPDCRHALPAGGARPAPPGVPTTRAVAGVARARRGAWSANGERP